MGGGGGGVGGGVLPLVIITALTEDTWSMTIVLSKIDAMNLIS